MLIYDKSTHSIYDENQYCSNTVYFTVGVTIEMTVDITTGKLITINGYCPLISAIPGKIEISNCIQGDYYFDKKIMENVKEHMAYSLDEMLTIDFFNKKNLWFDENSCIIKMGIESIECKKIAINSNITVSVNKKNEIQCIYVKPDKIL